MIIPDADSKTRRPTNGRGFCPRSSWPAHDLRLPPRELHKVDTSLSSTEPPRSASHASSSLLPPSFPRSPRNSAHEMSKSGLVPSSSPMIPKLGSGFPLAASRSVYHQTLALPKSGHPTASQKALAFSGDGTASLDVCPLTGNPVSVIQTILRMSTAAAAATVWSIAASNSALARPPPTPLGTVLSQ
ncbi:hypothetical protein VTG60DRAFT_830 [Thermothelomyces hinnuleus]